MAAYNDVDAVPCCANPWLLQEFLRDQHGFDGLVMADMGAIDRLAEMTGDLSSAGRAALLAGVDLSLCDRSYVDLGALAEEDPQVMTALDASCLRVLEMKDRFGLLGPTGEDGATDGSVGPGHPGVDPVDLAPLQAATARASRELAAASLVLLSNESAGGDGSADTSPAPVLPLDAASLKHLAVVGPFADDVPCMLGDYVPPLPDGSARSIGRALADTLPQAEVMVDGVATPEWLTGVESPLTGADAVVVVLGGTSHRSFEDEFADNGAIAGAAGQATNGEGVDRADISLPLLHRPGQDPVDQDDLIRRVRQTTPVGVPVIAVVVAGRPHVITEVLDQADSVLWAGYPGPFGGDVVADALLGRAELTGRLPFTLPRASGVVPVRYNDHQSARGVYQDQTDPVLLPFGHGLRYTEVTAEQVQVAELAEEDSDLGEFVRISARFRNPSDRTTRVTEPVFVHRRGGTHVPRQRELVGHLATRLVSSSFAGPRWVRHGRGSRWPGRAWTSRDRTCAGASSGPQFEVHVDRDLVAHVDLFGTADGHLDGQHVAVLVREQARGEVGRADTDAHRDAPPPVGGQVSDVRDLVGLVVGDPREDIWRRAVPVDEGAAECEIHGLRLGPAARSRKGSGRHGGQDVSVDGRVPPARSLGFRHRDMDLRAGAGTAGAFTGQHCGQFLEANRGRDHRPWIDLAAGKRVHRPCQAGRCAEDTDGGDVLQHQGARVDEARGLGEADVDHASSRLDQVGRSGG
jgi:hypothetical protein